MESAEIKLETVKIRLESADSQIRKRGKSAWEAREVRLQSAETQIGKL